MLATRVAFVLLCGLGLVAPTVRASAQQCTVESIAARPDTWKENPANLALARETAPSDLYPAILKRLEPVAAMFREAYPEPRGTAAEGYKAIRKFGTEQEGGPAQYGYVSLYKTWLCPVSTGQSSRADETGNWAYAYVNSVHSLLKALTDKPLQVSGRPTRVWLLARRIGSLRGEPLYEPWMGLTMGRALVFARQGAFPWKPVSQKQYLEAVEASLTQGASELNDAADQVIRDIEKNIEEMKKTLTGAMRDKVVADMERALADARAQRLANTGKLSAGVAGELKVIEHYRAQHTEAELAQPAILPQGITTVFRGAFGTEADGGHRVVTVDDGYFRRDMPADAAQLITLVWRAEDGAASTAWHEGFERRFPIDKLRALLGR